MPTHCPGLRKHLIASQGSQWFSSLNLKSGYWQVEMDEESKPLTAFTVGPLELYDCERMPFRPTNTPAMFQRLMETCLGDLNFHWCIIYLDDIVIFSKDLVSHLQVACPLHKLTSGENAGKKKAAIKWDSRCQQAFDDLKTLCTTAPILAYANFSKPFKLHTDACGTGLGAVLYET